MKNPSPPIARGAAWLGALTVLLANARYLAGLPAVLDPMLSMEPFYIDMARRPVARIVGEDPGWGPLYALWLKPFVALLGDPLKVYAANVYALSLAVSALVYCYVLLLTRRAAVAAGAALFFLIGNFNVPLYSKVSAFALLIVLAGAGVAEMVPPGARRTSVVSIGVLLAAYARPELYPAALGLWFLAAWRARREAREARRIWWWPATALAAVVIVAAAAGTPLPGARGGPDRFLLALQEHFAWNWNGWHGAHRPVFSIWEREFGGAPSVLRAALNNPRALAHHATDNLLGAARFMCAAPFDHYPLLVPASRPRWVTAENVLAAAAGLGLLLAVAARAAWRRALLDRYREALLQYAILAIVGLAAAVAIFPAPHYLAIPGVLLMLAATMAATVVIPDRPSRSLGQRAAAALACFLAVPRPFVLPSAYVVPGSPFTGQIAVSRTVTDTVAFVRDLHLPPPVEVLSTTDGIGELLGAGFGEVKAWQKGAQPLEAYMRDRNVGLVLNLEGGRESFAIDDPYWSRLQVDPAAAGFTPLSVPGHERVGVYVRSDLLSAVR